MDESVPESKTARLPLTEENLTVDKRRVETGKVRVSTVVTEHQETVSQLLRQEDVEIHRVPKNLPVSAAPPVRQEGDTVIVPILEEVLVVEKRLVLKEEIHIAKRTTMNRSAHPVTLRKEDAVIEHESSERGETEQYQSVKE